MDKATRDELIARYAEGPAIIAAAFAAVPADQIDSSQIVGEWTPRQIVHHTADSEATSYIRLRRLLAEDHPVIASYDEEEFARKLHYERPAEQSLAVLHAVRASSAELLNALSEDEWQREGTHSDSGRYTVEDWLSIYADHCHDHAEQIRRVAGL